MLTDEQRRKLARLRNFGTAYEVELVLAEGRKMLVCYTNRRSTSGLLSVIRERWQQIYRVAGIPFEEKMIAVEKKTVKFYNGAVARFSGRTERDAIICGELPFIGSPASGS